MPKAKPSKPSSEGALDLAGNSSPATRGGGSAPIRLLLLSLFASGAAGLIYQTIAGRSLRLLMGNSTLAMTTVLAAFMTGLAIGGWAGTWLARTRHHPLKLFAALEVFVALYFSIVPFLAELATPLFRDLYESTGSALPILTGARFLVSLVILAPPTIAMGATLPVASRLAESGESSGRIAAGTLFGINALGASLGALLSGYVLMPSFGMAGTLWSGIALSLISAGLAATQIGQLALPESRLERASDPAASGASLRSGSVVALLTAYALSGFAGMAYEIAWSRVLALIVGSTVYAFCLMLAAFIGGLAAGSLAFTPLARNANRAVRGIIGAQIAAGILSLVLLPFIDRIPAQAAMWFAAHRTSFTGIQLITAAVSVAVLFAPAFCLGAVYPLVVAALRQRKIDTSRAVGAAYCFNTIGSIVGAIVGGFVLVPLLGLRSTLLVAAGCNVAAAALLWVREPRSHRSRWAPIGVGLALALAAAALIRGPWDAQLMSIGPIVHAFRNVAGETPKLDDVVSRARESEILFHRESIGTTVTVKKRREVISLLVDGKADASSAPADMGTQLFLAHVPLLLHERPRDVLVIGLASGITLGAAGLHEVASIECAELVPAMKDAARFFSLQNRDVLDDPRTRLTWGDGRNHLALTDRHYDIITSEPSNPWIAGIGDLFTIEFFQLMRNRLREGGIACVWMEGYTNSPAMIRSVIGGFQSVFPNCFVVESHSSDLLLLGRRGEWNVDAEAMAARMSAPRIQPDLDQLKIKSVPDLLRQVVFGPEGCRSFAAGTRWNTDDNALLEFSAPRTMLERQSFLDERGLLSAWVQNLDFLFQNPPVTDRARDLQNAAERATQARKFLVSGHLAKRAGASQAMLAAYREAYQLAPGDPVVGGSVEATVGQVKEAIRRRDERSAREALNVLRFVAPHHPALPALEAQARWR